MDEMGLAYGILCDKNVPPRLKNKFYGVVVTPTMLYGVYYWPLKNSYVQKMKVTEIRMLMDVHTKRDNISNEDILGKVRTRWEK